MRLSHSRILPVVPDIQKASIPTFDDGYEDAYSHAFPCPQAASYERRILHYYRYGRHIRLSDMAGERNAGCGNEIGAHSEHHPDLTKITTHEDAAGNTRKHSDTRTTDAKPVLSSAYPGRYNPAVLKEFKTELGRAVCRHHHSAIAAASSPRFELPRDPHETGGR